LILGEGLGGKQVQGTRFWDTQQGIKNRHIVAQRLARGSTSDHSYIFATQDGGNRTGLVYVQPLHPTLAQGTHYPWLQVRRDGRVASGPGRQMSPSSDPVCEAGIRTQFLQRVEQRQSHGGIIAIPLGSARRHVSGASQVYYLGDPTIGKLNTSGAPSVERR